MTLTIQFNNVLTGLRIRREGVQFAPRVGDGVTFNQGKVGPDNVTAVTWNYDKADGEPDVWVTLR